MGQEREREGEKHQCVVASHVPPTGDLACNPGMCPGWELNWWPFVSQTCIQSTKPRQPGQSYSLLIRWINCLRFDQSSESSSYLFGCNLAVSCSVPALWRRGKFSLKHPTVQPLWTSSHPDLRELSWTYVLMVHSAEFLCLWVAASVTSHQTLMRIFYVNWLKYPLSTNIQWNQCTFPTVLFGSYRRHHVVHYSVTQRPDFSSFYFHTVSAVLASLVFSFLSPVEKNKLLS